MKIHNLFVFLLISTVAFGADFNGPDDACIKCLCHGRTGCFRLRNCASYSIRQDYWETAGSPTVSLDKQGTAAFNECMRDDECIRETIRGFMREFPNPDCNRDGKVDCKDFAMIHYERNTCHMPNYNSVYVRRLDSCLKDTMGANAPKPGWDVPAQ